RGVRVHAVPAAGLGHFRGDHAAVTQSFGSLAECFEAGRVPAIVVRQEQGCHSAARVLGPVAGWSSSPLRDKLFPLGQQGWNRGVGVEAGRWESFLACTAGSRSSRARGAGSGPGLPAGCMPPVRELPCLTVTESRLARPHRSLAGWRLSATFAVW